MVIRRAKPATERGGFFLFLHRLCSNFLRVGQNMGAQTGIVDEPDAGFGSFLAHYEGPNGRVVAVVRVFYRDAFWLRLSKAVLQAIGSKKTNRPILTEGILRVACCCRSQRSDGRQLSSKRISRSFCAST